MGKDIKLIGDANDDMAAVALRNKRKSRMYSLLGWTMSVGFVLSVILVGLAFVFSYIYGREQRNDDLAKSVFDDIRLTLTEAAMDRGFGLYLLGEGGNGITTDAETNTNDIMEQPTQVETEEISDIVSEGDTENAEDEGTEINTAKDTEIDSESDNESGDTVENVTDVPEDTSDLPTSDQERLEVAISDIAQGAYKVTLINKSNYAPDAERLEKQGFSFDHNLEIGRPLVLVIHAHTCEEYSKDGKYVYLSDEGNRTTDGRYTVTAVGEHLTSELNRLGVTAVHCSVIHDKDSSLDSYDQMKKSIELMLEMYPTIKYVIDVHRIAEVDDDGQARRVLVSGLDDADATAQIRIEVPFSQNDLIEDKKEQERTDESLRLAFSLRQEMNEELSGLCGPVVLCNLDMYIEGVRYLSVSIGGLGNTVEDANRAADSFAGAFADLAL